MQFGQLRPLGQAEILWSSLRDITAFMICATTKHGQLNWIQAVVLPVV